MCDYSLERVRSRPAKSATNSPHVTSVFHTWVCLAGRCRSGGLRSPRFVELAFSILVTVKIFLRLIVGYRVETLGHATAIFRQLNKDGPFKNHDALEFPDGRIVLLTRLSEGQEATVLQLPAQQATVAEADAQQRIAYVD